MDDDRTRPPVSPAPRPTAIETPLPRPASERFSSIDTLRGFALLGILVPNIWAFAWPMAAMTDPSVAGDTPANHLAHDITSTAFFGKFMFLFALLFGSGVVMYGRKFDAADGSGRFRSPLATGWSLWHIRCVVLLGFGLIHAYLFWYGDILTYYALAGLTLLWWVRRLNPHLQLWGGLGLFLFGALLLFGITMLGYMGYSQGEVESQQLMGGDPSAEIAGYRGSFIDAFRTRFFTTLTMQFFFAFLMMPALWGIMTMGMGLTRLRILTGERSSRFYAVAAFLLLPLGALLTLAMYRMVQHQFPELPGFAWQGMAQAVGVPLALGYGAMVILLSKQRWARPLTRPLAAVGRMALTNYFLHTLLCTTLFYGYGLGYFAQIEFPQLWLVVLGVWAVNIIFSLLWLRAFRMGPFEWVWRALTYRRLVQIK